MILVGIVSGTPIRHIVQLIPALISLALFGRGYRWAPYSAVSIFAFWLLIMALIWLYLIGIATVFNGSFTPVEIALTFVVGASCLAGLLAVNRDRAQSSVPSRLLTSILFMGFQLAAMWVSFQPFVVRR